MNNHARRMSFLILSVILAAWGVGFRGCQHPAESRTVHASISQSADAELAAIASLSRAELQQNLSDLARAHDQKGLLATWVALPFVGPPVTAAIRPFYREMGEKQAVLATELRNWAKDRGIDLTYRPQMDIEGRAMALMEARQEKVVRADGPADFDRDMLMQMYNDYEWQICIIQALLPSVKDPALRSYLERSQKVHEEGSGQIMALLRRFKWAG